ncbi:non-ribosomal peptide synthetase, partial [Pollutimonas bauzanensis]
PLLRIEVIRLAEAEHVLLVSMHHIVSDGWSIEVLLKEFVRAYRACRDGQALALPLLPIQYVDYGVWQRSRLESGERERQLTYWRTYLGDQHPVLALPMDHARQALGQYIEAHLALEVPDDLALGIRRLANKHGATPFMVLLSALQILLHRYTGQADIRIGIPNANRDQGETQGVIGFFVNTQVIRTQIDGRMSLDAVLEAVKRGVVGAQAHQDLPFDVLVEALKPERSLSHTPLFQVMHSHQRTAGDVLVGMGGLVTESYPLTERAAQFDLALNTAEDQDGRLSVSFAYARELFAPATIKQLAEHYIGVIRGLASGHGEVRLVSDLAMLDVAQRNQLLAQGRAVASYPAPIPVHDRVESQAQLAPDAQALVYGEAALSYAELNARANRLAHHLIGLGVGPETKVGVALERSVELVVALLAVLKAGGAYVPLDPSYPAERLAYMMVDSGLELVLTHSVSRQALPLPEGVTALEVDRLDVSARPASNPEVTVHPESLAYVIYTSGSTGRPKGAGNRHGALANRLDWMQQAYGLDSSDTVLQKTPFSFDVSVWEFFWPLMAGARLAVAPPGAHRDPAELVALIERHQVTTLHFVPSMLQAFVAHDGAAQCIGIHRIVCSGEALPAALQDRTLALLPQARLYNLYGPTEAAIDVTHWTCSAGDAVVPIGRPIDNVQTYVLDASMNLAPPGVPGELYLGGAGLGRGYEGKPGLTAERFVPDPYGEDGGRLYRTGDLARWNDAGALEYLGRIDHQVKIRGFRIELGELEAQLQAQPGVREAIVTAQEGPGGARLVGYVTAQAGQVLDTTTLRAHVSAALPDYMVPSGIVVLDALPLSPNGKVDRKALPAPEFASQGYEPPQGDVEKALATIWQEVLGVERVGRHDNFFELGGHSMVAIQLLEYIRRCGWKADARYLFSHPRLSQFALSMIKASSLRDSAAEHFSEIPEGCDLIAPSMLTLLQFRHEDLRRIERGVPGGARNIQDIYPLAPLQEGMLFHHVEQPQGDVYVHTLLLSFSSKDKLLQFAQCLNVLIERHDALRTAVLWEELPEPVQVVLRQATLELEWLSSDESASLGTAVERLASYVDPRTFRIDIRRAPMMRAIAVQDDHEGMWFLKLASHHLVVDHTSVDMLLGEMNLIFAGHQHALQKPIPFRNFIARARSKFQRSDAESFFRGMLADVREPSAPFGQSHVNADGVDVNEAHIELDPRLVATLREQAIHLGVSLAAFLHLAWGLVVAKSTATQDAVFGTVLFGRMGAGDGAERAVGLFINTLPFRVRLNGQRVETCVRQVHGALTQLLQHEHTPLASALRCSGVPAGTPLFSSILNYRYVGDRVRADGTGAWAGIVGLESRERSNYPFTLNVNDSGGGIELIAQVINTVSAQQVCELARDAVVAIANAVKAGSGVGVNDIDILPDVVTAQLLESGARLPRNAEPTLVHERYGEWAHGNPEAMSVVCGTEALTYGELNERTNRLAHHLISLDVGPETKVGVALERSVELVVALLAVLKAGGAYVPLDPSYPADRLAYMMADSGLGLVLTHSMLRQALPLPDGMTTLEIDRLDVSTQPATNPEVTVHPENLAYVIYTSGSTGRPKGAQLTHRNVARLLAATNEWFAFGPSDVWTMFHSYAFDFSVWELFGALCHGGKLVVVPHLVSRSPEEFLGLLRREGVTVLNQTPSAFRQLMQAPGVYEGGLSLRMVIFGGEALDPQTLGPWVEHYGDAAPRLVNMYGITETTVHVTYRPITRADLAGQCSPVGKAIPDLGLYVLDGGGHLLPVGVPGELHVAGDGLARGYLDRAGLTAERFVPDPFDEAGGRLYRTGDLARWSADGELEYLGRFDHQVKIRGFRIELGEVEAQLQAQPGVREVIVTAQEGPGGARLVGYVTAQAGEVLDPATLRVRVSTTVPDYMVPSAIMVLPSLPLTVNGKVDRKALPAPEFASQGYEPPQGDVEAALATIWQDVLGVERVGRHDNFFELGGDSILSLKVVSGAQQAGIPMAVRQLFEHQALQALAAVLHSGGRERTQIPVIPQGERQAVPLSYAQQRQWFLWNLQPQGSAYHIAGGLRFQGGLDVAAVRASFDVLVQRHESLRTTFEQRDEGTAVQVIHDSLPYDYAFTDVTDDGDPSARLRYVAETFGRRPFDLTKGPLLRIEVIRLAEAEHVLLVSMH